MLRKLRTSLLLAVAILAIAVAAPAVARGKASISINEHNPYEYGEQITFSVENARSDTPWVVVQCYQDGGLVFYEAQGMWNGAPGNGAFTLGPTVAWEYGDADCIAELGDFKRSGFKTQAKVKFHVYG